MTTKILKTMPAHKSVARVTLEQSDEYIVVKLGEREFWIEVSDDGDLVAHAHLDQDGEDIVTVGIKADHFEITAAPASCQRGL